MIETVLARKNMAAAWEQVQANRGAPGIDAVTLKRWGRNWETNIERLRQQVRTNTYHPNRPRRFKVLKKDGTTRELSILTVSDRVLQRAVLNVLEDVFERLFLNCSFGYRPHRSVANAITAVVRHRERGLTWLFDADIEDCFDNLDQELIRLLIEPVVEDAIVRNLLGLWLKAGTKTPSPLRQKHPESSTLPRRDGKGRRVGVPLGAVISPLFCNVVLHELDTALTRGGWTPVRYADDFVVLTSTEAQAHVVAGEVANVLGGLRLQLNRTKTRITSFEVGFRFLGVEFKGDTYSYVYQDKRIVVKGPTTRILHLHRPQFY